MESKKLKAVRRRGAGRATPAIFILLFVTLAILWVAVKIDWHLIRTAVSGLFKKETFLAVFGWTLTTAGVIATAVVLYELVTGLIAKFAVKKIREDGGWSASRGGRWLAFGAAFCLATSWGLQFHFVRVRADKDLVQVKQNQNWTVEKKEAEVKRVTTERRMWSVLAGVAPILISLLSFFALTLFEHIRDTMNRTMGKGWLSFWRAVWAVCCFIFLSIINLPAFIIAAIFAGVGGLWFLAGQLIIWGIELVNLLVEYLVRKPLRATGEWVSRTMKPMPLVEINEEKKEEQPCVPVKENGTSGGAPPAAASVTS